MTRRKRKILPVQAWKEQIHAVKTEIENTQIGNTQPLSVEMDIVYRKLCSALCLLQKEQQFSGQE